LANPKFSRKFRYIKLQPYWQDLILRFPTASFQLASECFETHSLETKVYPHGVEPCR